MDILLLGPPGAGKGTQGAILGQAMGLPKFATGDLLRDAVKRGTPLGLEARSVMEAGHLVGDDIILGVVREELGKPEASKGVIFDGVVRTIPQAAGLERILKEKNRKMDAVRPRSPPGSGPTGIRPPRSSPGTSSGAACGGFPRWARSTRSPHG